MIDVISKLIFKDQNREMGRIPTLEEVKSMIFELNGDSSIRPDGSTGLFFQSSWNIVSEDIWNMTKASFVGWSCRGLSHILMLCCCQRKKTLKISRI